MSKTNRIVATYNNEYGAYEPGDKVLAITVCTHNVKVEPVEYVGYVERKVYNFRTSEYDVQKFVQIRRMSKRYRVVWKDTGEPAKYPYSGRPTEYKRYTAPMITTLYYNRIFPINNQAIDLPKTI